MQVFLANPIKKWMINQVIDLHFKKEKEKISIDHPDKTSVYSLLIEWSLTVMKMTKLVFYVRI